MIKDTGLMTPGTPLVYLNCYGGKEHPDWRHDFGAFLGGAKSVTDLEAERKKRGWPELLYYMIDEPGDETRNAAARSIFEDIYHDLPVRTVTAIGQLGIDTVGDLYKVWIAAWGDMSDALIRQAQARQRELWVYECWSMAQLPEMARYYAGFWTYRCGVKGNSDWVYISTAGSGENRVYPRLSKDGQLLHTDNWVFGYVLPGPNGPIDTLGLELRREGIDDFRYCELLDGLIDQVAGSNDPKGKKALADGARRLRGEVRRRFEADAFGDMAGGYVWFHDYRPQPELELQDYGRLRRAVAGGCVALARARGR